MPSKALGDHTTELNSNSNSAKLRQTCDACQTIKTRCSRDKPSCARCKTQNISCHYSVSRRIGRPRRLVPPPSPVSRSHARRLDEQIQASHFYSVDWSGVDVDVENDRMITDGSEALSNSSSDAVEHQRNQNDRSVTPRVGQAPDANITTSSFSSARASAPELNDQDLFNSFIGNADFSRLSSSSLSSSLSNEIEAPSNHAAQGSLDDSEVDRQSSSLHNFGQHIEHSQFSFTPTEELDAFGPASWEFSNEATVLPARKSACRCLESALSITLSIGQGHVFHYPGTMDLALDIEAQLRETIPLAVQCSACKTRQGEILKLFSNAMADVVDLLQQLCNAEFPVSSDSPPSRRPRSSSLLDGFKWLQQPKLSGRPLSSSSHQLVSHERSISGSSSHSHVTSNNDGGPHRRRTGTANGIDTSATHSHELQLPSPPNTASSSDQRQLRMNPNTELSGWRILVGRHQIIGDDRKFVLMHLLRRRLCALSNVLEGLIRAMQDLRMSLKRVDCFLLYDDDALDTRKPMKTASKLYDIIDQLEKIQI